MFVIQLRFSKNKPHAARHLEAHRRWIDQGFRDGVFLLVGTLEPEAGGGILAHNTSRVQLEQRIQADPFVVEDIVTPEITEITPQGVAESVAPFIK